MQRAWLSPGTRAPGYKISAAKALQIPEFNLTVSKHHTTPLYFGVKTGLVHFCTKNAHD